MIIMKYNVPNVLGGLDHFLAQSLDEVIRKNLGKHTINKIEKRLQEKYDLSLAQSIEQFPKLDVVLREHFGKGADGIESEFFKKICSISGNKKNRKNVSRNDVWITIQDINLAGTIVEAFGDPDKKSIVGAVTDTPKTTYEILRKTQIPQTSGYRKINHLIDLGILVAKGQIETAEGKKINKYTTYFQNFRINIAKNVITVDVQISKEILQDSSILSALFEI